MAVVVVVEEEKRCSERTRRDFKFEGNAGKLETPVFVDQSNRVEKRELSRHGTEAPDGVLQGEQR